ncbi:sulfotransferase 1B1-like isoform X2 [Mytilus galloprovincialis]|uniref:sulfotransferase 1B1-like isoform X2 n=1 Tax=Mytilus galloprovincialis TaxID=29158 RepID=UPI003F7BCFAE
MESRGVWNEEEVAVYPPIKYKEWTLFPWPHWKEDTDKYLKLLKNFQSREDDILLCTVQKGDTFMSGWFNYTREMVSAVEKYSNVIHVLFEDLKLNQTAEIKRIADFLEVPYTNKLINEIADKCEFDKLKTNKLDGTAEYAKDNKSTLFRKGIIGDWKNWFTVAQNEQFDEMYKREMKDVSMSFIYEDPSGK